jgi:hypothetical protein
MTDMKTYTTGFKLKPTRAVVKGDIVRLCELLQQSFGEGYNFEPEAILEGGIVWKDWPGKSGEMYKTMRFSYNVSWPSVSDNVMEDWKNSEDVTNIINKPNNCGKYVRTFLKAFDDAPYWTRKELNMFANCIEQTMDMTAHTFPPTKSLKHSNS